MAKVDIQDRAWSDSRFKAAARTMGTGTSEVRGYLIDIWHGSQQLGLVYVTEEEIGDWLDLRPRLKPRTVIDALAGVGLLELTRIEDVPSEHLRDVFAKTKRIFRVKGNKAKRQRI